MKRTSTEAHVYMRRQDAKVKHFDASNVTYHKFSHGAVSFTLNGENVNVMLEFPLRPCACILRDLRLCSKNVLIRILKNMAQNMRPLQIFKSLFAHAQLNDDIKIKKIKKIIDGLLCVRAGLARPLTKCFFIINIFS